MKENVSKALVPYSRAFLIAQIWGKDYSQNINNINN